MEKQIPFPEIKLFDWRDLPKWLGRVANRVLDFNWSTPPEDDGVRPLDPIDPRPRCIWVNGDLEGTIDVLGPLEGFEE